MTSVDYELVDGAMIVTLPAGWDGDGKAVEPERRAPAPIPARETEQRAVMPGTARPPQAAKPGPNETEATARGKERLLMVLRGFGYGGAQPSEVLRHFEEPQHVVTNWMRKLQAEGKTTITGRAKLSRWKAMHMSDTAPVQAAQDDGRDYTARLMGDPPPGRSAQDQIEAQRRANGED
jgi:hypothetical protein